MFLEGLVPVCLEKAKGKLPEALSMPLMKSHGKPYMAKSSMATCRNLLRFRYEQSLDVEISI